MTISATTRINRITNNNVHKNDAKDTNNEQTFVNNNGTDITNNNKVKLFSTVQIFMAKNELRAKLLLSKTEENIDNYILNQDIPNDSNKFWNGQ